MIIFYEIFCCEYKLDGYSGIFFVLIGDGGINARETPLALSFPSISLIAGFFAKNMQSVR